MEGRFWGVEGEVGICWEVTIVLSSEDGRGSEMGEVGRFWILKSGVYDWLNEGEEG